VSGARHRGESPAPWPPERWMRGRSVHATPPRRRTVPPRLRRSSRPEPCPFPRRCRAALSCRRSLRG
jgi:hypothetical protein